MSLIKTDWNKYYNMVSRTKPRPILFDALFRFLPAKEKVRTAIDIGCGDGVETLAILSQGWNVLAVDGEHKGIEKLLKKVPSDDAARLSTLVSKFDNLKLPEVDLIHAGYSIPFCASSNFNELWQTIKKAIKPGGRFVGQLFGPMDSWAADNPGMTFHSREEVVALFSDFNIECLFEKNQEGYSTGGQKNWHVFDVIAQKQ